MSTELALRPQAGLPAAQDFRTMLEMADVLLKSGLLPDSIRTPQAAFAIMQKGRELGVPPMQAIAGISVIKGKPTAGAELMLALIYRDHGDSAVRFAESTNDRCVIAYRRRSWPEPSTYAFTMEDAKRAEIARGDNWRKYPAAMLRARCISAVARMAFPDSIGGMHTPEELDAEVTVTSDGEVVVIEQPPTPQEPAPPLPAPAEEPEHATSDALPFEPPKPADDPVDAEIRALLKERTGGDKAQWEKLLNHVKHVAGIPPARSIHDATAAQKQRVLDELKIPGVPA